MTMTTSDPLAPAKAFLLEKLTQNSERPLPVLVAVSGGADSMALLYLLSTWGVQEGFAVTAAHFHHQLRGDWADRDEAFVRDYCQKKNIPFVASRGDTRRYAKENHETVEEAARTLRYAFLRKAARERGCRYILTAHHADDNVETVLLNLCRGTGIAGLAGIPQVQDECICRPFLDIPRRALEDYGTQWNIPHIEDETNGEDDASRNLLRHRVLPVLEQINPRFAENISRTTHLLTEQRAAVDGQIAALVRRALPLPQGKKLAWAELKPYPPAIQTGAVLSLMALVGGSRKDLSQRHAAAVLALRHAERPRSQLSLPYHLRARTNGRFLLIERIAPSPESVPIALDRPVSFGRWTVSLGMRRSGESYALDPAALQSAPAAVTRWRSGDWLHLPGSHGARSVKRLCVDRGIGLADREALPVLRVGAIPAAIPGIGVQEAFLPSGEEVVWVSFARVVKPSKEEPV